MIDTYLDATIAQARDRAKVLKGKVQTPLLSSEHGALQSRCENRLDEIIGRLDYLLTNPLIRDDSLASIRIRIFRRALEELAQLECTGIAALSRPGEDDVLMNRLVFQIHKEINYPLNPPAVCCLSQQYYVIDSSIGLLSVPLAEPDFLLHLPDLYHELAHPMIVAPNNPKVEGFQKEFSKFLAVISAWFQKEKASVRRSTGPKEYFHFALEVLERLWSLYWSREVFCDLFATYTLGAAYGWSHLHLTACTNANPFNTQTTQLSKHPPDQARLEVILCALDLLGRTKEKQDISSRWNELFERIGAKQDSDYRKACPKELLEQAAVHAFEGIKAIGCRLADSKASGDVHNLLNSAWEVFWSDPSKYSKWEQEQIKELRDKHKD